LLGGSCSGGATGSCSGFGGDIFGLPGIRFILLLAPQCTVPSNVPDRRQGRPGFRLSPPSDCRLGYQGEPWGPPISHTSHHYGRGPERRILAAAVSIGCWVRDFCPRHLRVVLRPPRPGCLGRTNPAVHSPNIRWKSMAGQLTQRLPFAEASKTAPSSSPTSKNVRPRRLCDASARRQRKAEQRRGEDPSRRRPWLGSARGPGGVVRSDR